MRTDSLDVSSLVSYINDVKPFHSKLTEVVVEYQANDNMSVKIADSSKMEMRFSSVWELQAVSDGKRVQYRIPAAVFPRYSEDFNQCDRKGVTDEVPGAPGAYFVPYNNGVEISVNGITKLINSDYVIDESRTVIQFLSNFPKLGDAVCINWRVVDRVFVAINDTWRDYKLEYSSVADGMEMFPYDTSKFDSADAADEVLDGVQYDTHLSPIGRVRVLTDPTGKDYYVFEFNDPLPLDTRITIRVEQREAYNGWTQTKIADTVAFKDLIKFKDTVNAWIVDPGTWDIGPGSIEKFGVDITPSRVGNFDSEDFDVMDYDSAVNPTQIGYYQWLSLTEVLADTFGAKFAEAYTDRVGLNPKDSIAANATETQQLSVQYTPADSVSSQVFDGGTGSLDDFLFDQEVFDSIDSFDLTITKNDSQNEKSATKFGELLTFQIVYGDGTVVNQGVYNPDSNGVVVVNPPADSVEILHNYGYNPLVSVYLNDSLIYPQAVKYTSLNSLVVEFSQPRSVVIRLA